MSSFISFTKKERKKKQQTIFVLFERKESDIYLAIASDLIISQRHLTLISPPPPKRKLFIPSDQSRRSAVRDNVTQFRGAKKKINKKDGANDVGTRVVVGGGQQKEKKRKKGRAKSY